MSTETRSSRLIVFLGSVAAATAAIVTLGDKLHALATSAWFGYLYVALEVFWPVWIALAAVVVFREAIVLASVRFVGSFSKANFAVPARRTVLVNAGMAALVVAFVGGYFGFALYVEGRGALQVQRRVMTRRAARAFLEGDSGRAQFLARVCASVFRNSELCTSTLDSMEARQGWTAAYRKAFAASAPNSWARPAILLASYAQDRNWDQYEEALRELVQRFEEARSRLLAALRRAAAGDRAAARAGLNEVQDFWPGFGRAPALLRELEASGSGPYLKALALYGPEAVAEDLSRPFVPAGLTSRLAVPAARARGDDPQDGAPATDTDIERQSSDAALAAVAAVLDGGWRNAAVK